jgi:peptidoglycan/LPS O-acetylase OafA/YrhL
VSASDKDAPVLSGVRGFAALAVFASHVANLYYNGALFGRGGGQMGVMLFFILSGFLMAYLYIDRPPNAVEQRRFLLNRFARIYPMFFVVVVSSYIAFLTGSPVRMYRINSLSEVLKHLGLVHGVEVLWTIGPEIIFYLLFLVLWRVARYDLRMFVALIVLLCGAAWFPVELTHENSLTMLHDRLPYFIAGCLLGMNSRTLLSQQTSSRIWAKMAFWLSLLLFVGSFPTMPGILVNGPEWLTSNNLAGPGSDPWSSPFYLLTTTLLFVTAVIARPWIFTNRVAVFLGQVSFSVYLLHYVVLFNVKRLLHFSPPLTGIVLSLALTLLLATLCYLGIETPAKNFIRRLGRTVPAMISEPAQGSPP